jgi:3'(2'), 5'-bisphosphate nucleotidase
VLNQIDIQDIITIAKEAGSVIMQVYKQDFEVEYKQDRSPLTLADKKANDIIESGLSQLSIKLPILSEEGKKTPYEERKHWKYFWLIDPLDGTKEFVKKNGEFTVNIALIHKDMPVLGVVYAPALDVCYWAKKGEGAFKDGKKLPFKIEGRRNTYKIVASRSHMSDETRTFIDAINVNKEKEIISIGSSLKICLVAEGEANMYPRLGPTMEWDTGAAHSIAVEAGVLMKRYVNNNLYIPLLYNKKKLKNGQFIVWHNL